MLITKEAWASVLLKNVLVDLSDDVFSFMFFRFLGQTWVLNHLPEIFLGFLVFAFDRFVKLFFDSLFCAKHDSIRKLSTYRSDPPNFWLLLPPVGELVECIFIFIVEVGVADNHAFGVIDPYLAIITDAFNFLLIQLELVTLTSWF